MLIQSTKLWCLMYRQYSKNILGFLIHMLRTIDKVRMSLECHNSISNNLITDLLKVCNLITQKYKTHVNLNSLCILVLLLVEMEAY